MFEGGRWNWDDGEHFGQVLVSLRRSRNLSQRDLAKLSGLSPTIVSTYESGGRKKGKEDEPLRPTAKTLARLADGLARNLNDVKIDPDIRRDAFQRLMVAAKYEELPAGASSAQGRRSDRPRTDYLVPQISPRASREERESLRERAREARKAIDALFDELDALDAREERGQ